MQRKHGHRISAFAYYQRPGNLVRGIRYGHANANSSLDFEPIFTMLTRILWAGDLGSSMGICHQEVSVRSIASTTLGVLTGTKPWVGLTDTADCGPTWHLAHISYEGIHGLQLLCGIQDVSRMANLASAVPLSRGWRRTSDILVLSGDNDCRSRQTRPVI